MHADDDRSRVPFPVDLTPDQVAAEEEIRASRDGKLADLFRILLHAPDVATGWAGLGTSIRYRLALDADVRELLICFVAHRCRCPLEEDAHRPLALEAGVPRSLLDDLDDWRSSAEIGDRHRAALETAESALRGEPAGSTAIDTLDARTLVELHALVAYYAAVSLFLNGMGLAGHR